MRLENSGSKLLLKLAPFLAILAYAYYPTFAWMVDRWAARDSYYAHGFLIPLVTLYWLWKKRNDITREVSGAWLPGFVVLAAGIGLQILSAAFRIYFASALSLVLILLGLAAVVGGRRVFIHSWYPLVFLLLMIPLPLLLISQTTLKMKFFVSDVASQLLTASGLEAHREGSYLVLPRSFLLVGDPCSGLRSFLAFLCLGFVFCYEGTMALWKRVLLVACGLPLAILSNVLRVYVMGLIAEIYGMKAVEGLVHDASGIVVFVLAFGAFMILRKKLEEPSHVPA